MEIESMTDGEIQAMLRKGWAIAISQGALRVQSASIQSLLVKGHYLPIPVVQVEDDAEIADVARVARQESDGLVESSSRWRHFNDGEVTHVLLDLTLVKPVIGKFTVAFTLEQHRKILEAAARLGYVAVTCGKAHGTMAYAIDRSMLESILRSTEAGTPRNLTNLTTEGVNS